jgi:curved DNA-binding protein CbpA
MAEVNEAWRVLGDPTRRAAYDAAQEPAQRRMPHVEFAPKPVTPATTRMIRLMVIAIALLFLVVFAGILINGFGGAHG